MRLTMTLILLAAAVLPAAQAQDDACSEADPCTWVVQVDENGLSAPGGDLEGTVGDWYRYEFNNVDGDGADHTITLDMDGSTVEVQNPGTVQTDPFELRDDRAYSISDDVTGDTLHPDVTFDDVGDGGDDTGGDGTGGDAAGGDEGDEVSQPYTPIAWVLLALAAIALFVRRR